MQYVLEFRGVAGFRRLVLDQRSIRPSYHAFDLVCGDQRHTVAPTIARAREVRDAYHAWAAKFEASGLATTGTIVIKPYRPGVNHFDGSQLAEVAP